MQEDYLSLLFHFPQLPAPRPANTTSPTPNNITAAGRGTAVSEVKTPRTLAVPLAVLKTSRQRFAAKEFRLLESPVTLYSKRHHRKGSPQDSSSRKPDTELRHSCTPSFSWYAQRKSSHLGLYPVMDWSGFIGRNTPDLNRNRSNHMRARINQKGDDGTERFNSSVV